MVTLLVVASLVALVAVLALHLPRALTRLERIDAEIEALEEHMGDLREEQGETAARLGELRAERESLLRPAP